MSPHRPVIASPPSARPPRSKPPHRWFIPAVVLLSLAVHLQALYIIAVLQRRPPVNTDNQGTIELLMVEAKGSQASQAGQPANPPAPEQPKADPVPPEKPKPDPPAPDVKPTPPPQAETDQAALPPPQPQPPKPETPPPKPPTQAQAQPTPPAKQQGPIMSLDGTDSDTNAMVLSGRILPASKDDRFRNRPPAYPDEAAMRGEQGDVVVVIHVSPAGVAIGADVIESSGSASLDRAALTAVLRWRFHPAMKDGQPIPFDMPFRFDFRPL